jgi:hypothetical protein
MRKALPLYRELENCRRRCKRADATPPPEAYWKNAVHHRVYSQVRTKRNEVIRARDGEGGSCREIANETGLCVRTMQKLIFGEGQFQSG